MIQQLLLLILIAGCSCIVDATFTNPNTNTEPATILRQLLPPQTRAFSTTGQAYYMSPIKTDWYTARRACRDSGMRLLQIKNEGKQIEVEYFFQEYVIQEPVWIGINDLVKEGVWTWDDGSKLVEGNWYLQNSPLRDCGSFSPDFKWDAMFCKEGIGNFVPLRFICETI